MPFKPIGIAGNPIDKKGHTASILQGNYLTSSVKIILYKLDLQEGYPRGYLLGLIVKGQNNPPILIQLSTRVRQSGV